MLRDMASFLVDKFKTVIVNFIQTKKENYNTEIINGVKFFYPLDLELSDDLLLQLDQFSQTAEDTAYSIYMDGKETVIY